MLATSATFDLFRHFNWHFSARNTSYSCRKVLNFNATGFTLNWVKNWLYKWAKCKASPNFNMIMINLTPLPNHSESLILESKDIFCHVLLFRLFKFTLKPPYRIAIGNFFLAIWDTSHWNFLVKFGLKTAWDMSYDILLSLLKFVNFWWLQGHLSILAKIGCLQKFSFLDEGATGLQCNLGGF